MRIIDISSAIDAAAVEPDPVMHEVMDPRAGAAHMCAEMRRHFGARLSPDDLPDGEFLSLDRLSLTTHTGTHVDAPSHYGSRAAYRPEGPRSIDEVPLDWFYRPGLVLDVSGRAAGVVGRPELEAAIERNGCTPAPLDIVLLRTGAAAWTGTPQYFTDFVGLDAAAIHFLLDLGVRVVGTDAFSLDAPFPHILEQFRQSGDPAVLWPAHVVGRAREYCQVERLGRLDDLPPSGFTVACFPVKIRGAGAGWARAVALVPD